MTKRRVVSVDPGICKGSRLCQMAAPEVFRMDDQAGVARVLTGEVEDSDALWDAAEGCPQEAISLADASSGEQLFP